MNNKNDNNYTGLSESEAYGLAYSDTYQTETKAYIPNPPGNGQKQLVLPRCASCQYWTRYSNSTFGRCECPYYKHGYIWVDEQKKKEIFYTMADDGYTQITTEVDPVIHDVYVFLYDLAGFGDMQIETGANFGCIHWREARDE